VPDGSAPDRLPIALITDLRRLLIGGGIMVLGFIVVIAAKASHASWAVAVAALILEVIGGLYATGGRSGYYEVAADGSLGQYLAKKKPDLRTMRATKIPKAD
jgi:hypothetical protein